MSETVEGRLKALAHKQGHPGSLDIADVGHMMQLWKQTKDDLEADNARLQTRVEELERQLAERVADWRGYSWPLIVDLERDRDRYKALAERHRQALQKWSMGGGHRHGGTGGVDTDKCPACLELAAAIAATPELTNC